MAKRKLWAPKMGWFNSRVKPSFEKSYLTPVVSAPKKQTAPRVRTKPLTGKRDKRPSSFYLPEKVAEPQFNANVTAQRKPSNVKHVAVGIQLKDRPRKFKKREPKSSKALVPYTKPVLESKTINMAKKAKGKRKRTATTNITPSDGGITNSYVRFGKVPRINYRDINWKVAILREADSQMLFANSQTTTDTARQAQTGVDFSHCMTKSNMRSLAAHTGVTASADVMMVPLKSQLKWLFKNEGITTTILYIYDLICKDETNTGPSGVWADVLSTVSATTSVHDVWERPTTHAPFRKIWRPIKITKIEMGGGAVHEHSVIIGGYRPISVKDVYTDSSLDYERNYSTASLFVAIGTPIRDTATATAVGLDTPSISFVARREMFAKVSTTAKATFSVYTNSIDQIATANRRSRTTDLTSVTGDADNVEN